jgi:hypothetical protein
MSAPKPKPDPTSKLVDEFGLVDEQLAALKKRHAQLRDCLLTTNDDAEAHYTLVGTVFEVEISAAGWERRITAMPKLIRAIGRKAFDAACTFPLRAFDALIPETEREKYIRETRTGPRKVSASRRFTALV